MPFDMSLVFLCLALPSSVNHPRPPAKEDRALVFHSTGHGFVSKKKGQYHDAIFTKRATVVPAIVESTGGVTPHLRAHVRRLERRSTGKGATDRTKYGTSRMSTKNFYVHHIQRMSTAAVSYDAKAIRRQITCKKQKVAHMHMHTHTQGQGGATQVAGAGAVEA